MKRIGLAIVSHPQGLNHGRSRRRLRLF
ncbi:hypothetical protein ACHAXR_005871 [Thalassiosira sp. AJA248-18]